MRFTIKLKLGLAFALIITLLLASAVMGTLGLGALNASFDHVMGGPVAQLANMQELNSVFLRVARAERDMLLHELSAAAGLTGRTRLLGDQGERARKTVTARIRDVISRIERVHPALGSHLRATITTGTFCTYSPPAPVTWDL